MAESVFDDKARQPDDHRLTAILGDSSTFWDEIRRLLKEEYGDLTEEWKFYGHKSGWTLKTLLKKRNLFSFLPMKGSFKITFIFGDRAVATVEQSDLPKRIIDMLKNARRYAEGRGIQIEVMTIEDVENVKRLVDIKIKN